MDQNYRMYQAELEEIAKKYRKACSSTRESIQAIDYYLFLLQ